MSGNPLLPDMLRLHEPDGAFAYAVAAHSEQPPAIACANQALCTMLGYPSPDALLSRSPADLIPGLKTLTGSGFGAFETGNTLVYHTIATKDGRQLPVAIASHVLRVGGREMNIVSLRETGHCSPDHQREHARRYRLGLLGFLSRTFAESEQELLDSVLRESMDRTGSRVGYLYFMNDQETEMTLHSWLDDRPAGTASLPAVCPTQEAGPWGEAATRRQPVIANHCAMPGPAHRCINLPVMDNGRIVIIAGLADRETAYTETDLDTLFLSIQGAWFVLQRKRLEADLVSAIKKAERAGLAKNQFLANMSHELRTPLNGIMGMNQLLRETPLNQEQQEYLALSMEAARHLSKVMTSLLDLSAIEADTVTNTPSTFDLEETLVGVIKPLALKAAGKPLILREKIDTNVPRRINGDEKKLRQILINLIQNAIKFTETGRVSVTVSLAETVAPAGDSVTLDFTVTDTGVGIPEDKLGSIFDRFALGEDYLTKKYSGTGLGLSISRELASAMGGTITVSSALGRGSTFTLTLPFRLKETRGRHTDIPETAASPLPLHILVAEDEQVNALVTSGMLKKHGHSVTVVGNGQHAIDALMHTAFDLVFMDVQIPVLNGLEVTEIVRRGAAENVCRTIPIVGLTAHASDADHQRCLDAGMDSVVTKPFEADDLLTAIGRHAVPHLLPQKKDRPGRAVK